MSDNKLLKENTIRRFMKLANVDTFTDSFIGSLVTESEKENTEDDTTTEEATDTIEEQEAPEEPEMDMGDEPEPEMDMDMDMDAEDEPEMGAADISLTEEEAQLLIDLGERLKEAMGDDMGEEEEDELEDMPMDDDLGAEEPGDEMEDEPAPGGRDIPGQSYGAMYEDQEELVNEILKRVTKRLVASRTKR